MTAFSLLYTLVYSRVNGQGANKTDYTFRMKVHYGFTPHWIGKIIQYGNFCDAVKDVWHEIYPSRLSEIYGTIDDIVLPLAAAWENDYQRWNEDPAQTAQLRLDRIKNALRKNIEWFNNHLPESQHASSPSIIGATNDEPVKVFNLQGICVGVYETESQAQNNLDRGIYIINDKKVKIN